jgi:hypothetical protein
MDIANELRERGVLDEEEWIQAKTRSTNQHRKKRRRRRRSCIGGLVRFERCGAIISMPS